MLRVLKVGGADGPETAYLHADHLGSPVAATDEAGAILWAEQFSPYGESIPGPAASAVSRQRRACGA